MTTTSDVMKRFSEGENVQNLLIVQMALNPRTFRFTKNECERIDVRRVNHGRLEAIRCAVSIALKHGFIQ